MAEGAPAWRRGHSRLQGCTLAERTRPLKGSIEPQELMIHTNSQPENYLTHFTNGEQTASADTTSDKGGGNRGFRPHELLEAALASCMNMTLRMCAQRYGIPLAGASVLVSLNRDSRDGPTFMYRADLQGSLSDAQRQQLLASLENCPVRATLSKRLQFAAWTE
jgi:putative redox protein